MRYLLRWRSEYVFVSGFLLFLLLTLSSTTQGQDQPQKKYWVYFQDKGPETLGTLPLEQGTQLYRKATVRISDRALRRRAKVLARENLIDGSDLPVYQPYVDELARRGFTPHVNSRWLNAVSVDATPDQVSSIASLPFVREVMPVVTLHRGKEPIEAGSKRTQKPSVQKVEALNYGPSLEQDSVINVPAVHNLGINGTGVLIGMLDSGFRWREHEALKNIRVIAEHDFIFNRDTTANGPNDVPEQDSHGTSTLSAIGGFMPGELIGPAYGASFILAKTEYIPTETQIEEDNWVAGIEWMESEGVDVVSSSLGYTTFDDQTGYSYSHGDFNGRTAVTTKAAVMAARKGVVVVNAMGNMGNSVGSIIAPADADSIISTGAVNYSGVLASFSSVGPTNDGRIKPDVVAPGVSIYVASTSGSNQYGRASGTSFSCPLTAGTAALVLSAHPEFTPIQVRDAIRNTASRADWPDNFYGWGVVNAKAAVLSGGLVFSNVPHLYYNDFTNIVVIFAASNTAVDNLGIRLWYSLDNGTSFTSVQMMPTSVANQFLAAIPQHPLGTLIRYYIDGVDQTGVVRRSPYNSPDSLFSFRYGEGDTSRPTSVPVPLTIPQNFVLYQNYPNPFNSSTWIQFYAPNPSDAEIVIYNTLGQKIRTLSFSRGVHQGINGGEWNGIDERGKQVPSGVYFYQLRTPTFSDTKRMLLIK